MKKQKFSTNAQKSVPRKINIPEAMKEFAGMLDKMPHWVDLCRQRDEAARRLRGE